MSLTPQHNPLAAMAEFVKRVAPFDPRPDGGTALTVELRLTAPDELAGPDGECVTFALTEHGGRALYEALCQYYDPADVGPCDRCRGRRLDQNLQCRDCGHVNGVFGQVLLEHAEKIRREEREIGERGTFGESPRHSVD